MDLGQPLLLRIFPPLPLETGVPPAGRELPGLELRDSGLALGGFGLDLRVSGLNRPGWERMRDAFLARLARGADG